MVSGCTNSAIVVILFAHEAFWVSHVPRGPAKPGLSGESVWRARLAIARPNSPSAPKSPQVELAGLNLYLSLGTLLGSDMFAGSRVRVGVW